MSQREPGDDEEFQTEDEDDFADARPLGELLAERDAEREAAKEQSKELNLSAMRAEGRLPPHAMDAERAVLGAILLTNSVFDDVIEAGLVASDFYRPAHGTIFEAIAHLQLQGEPVDTLTVVDELLRRGQLDRVGGAAAVSQLEAMLPTAAHAASYARLVHDKATRRRVIEIAAALGVDGYGHGETTEELVEKAQRAFTDLTVRDSDGCADRRALAHEVIDQIGKPAARGLPTGFRDIDDGLLQRGMHGGEVIIIAARPAMGKTALGHQIACHIADLGVPAAFFSLEMSAKQLISREIAGSSKLGASSWARELGSGHLQRAAGIVADRPLHLQACPGWTIGKIKARLRRMVSQLGIGFAAIDYLGLIAGTGEYKGNRVQEVGQVSRQIKQLAGELNIPIALLSQLNRGVEARAVKRPGLADLRDSGDIEQDADVALFIHRPEYYLKENTPENLSSVAEILVEKQRNGPTGICELYFNAETIRFGNLKRDHP